jgi:hypothetical protein
MNKDIETLARLLEKMQLDSYQIENMIIAKLCDDLSFVRLQSLASRMQHLTDLAVSMEARKGKR